ncbi:hypothetical protein [Citrobacter braakii]|uniref:hypothetical protein n=1 Tax=Citrobacter braakii TaxID=57706 RepID=UPI00155F9613|nr:hypothetical protein [Citrobacter braakii]NRF76632.1 hypothetical protein [Citrobacter braakii]
MLIIAKIIGVLWMLLCFVIVLQAFVRGVTEGKDAFGYFVASIFMWLLVAVAPIAIIKFGWNYIR